MDPFPDLYPHQITGAQWMQNAETLYKGGILADEFGLGKTRAVVHMMYNKRSTINKPILLVLPISVQPNWIQEIRHWFGKDAKILVYKNIQHQDEDLSKYQFVIATYRALSMDCKFKRVPKRQHHLLAGRRVGRNRFNILQTNRLLDQEWHRVILDQGEKIKNDEALQTKAAVFLKSDYRWIVSGAPVHNEISEEMDTLSSFLQLQRLSKEHFLRRNKTFGNHVDIPFAEKEVIQVPVELSEQERKYYEHMKRLQPKDDVKRKKKPPPNTILTECQKEYYLVCCRWEWLLRMRQSCCNASMVCFEQEFNGKDEEIYLDYHKELYPHGVPTSSKQKRVLQVIEELGNEKVIVFSYYKMMLELFAQDLAHEGISFVTVTGEKHKRQKRFSDFMEGDIRVLLITTTCASDGLTFTNARNVIVVEPWWGPFVERQMTDRVYHLQQKEKVTVYRMVCTDTIEDDHIYPTQWRKTRHFDEIFGSDFCDDLERIRNDRGF